MHLLVVPNSEHSLSTGIPTLIPAIAAFVGSIAANDGALARPDFTFDHNETTGAMNYNL